MKLKMKLMSILALLMLPFLTGCGSDAAADANGGKGSGGEATQEGLNGDAKLLGIYHIFQAYSLEIEGFKPSGTDELWLSSQAGALSSVKVHVKESEYRNGILIITIPDDIQGTAEVEQGFLKDVAGILSHASTRPLQLLTQKMASGKVVRTRNLLTQIDGVPVDLLKNLSLSFYGKTAAAFGYSRAGYFGVVPTDPSDFAKAPPVLSDDTGSFEVAVEHTDATYTNGLSIPCGENSSEIDSCIRAIALSAPGSLAEVYFQLSASRAEKHVPGGVLKLPFFHMQWLAPAIEVRNDLGHEISHGILDSWGARPAYQGLNRELFYAASEAAPAPRHRSNTFVVRIVPRLMLPLLIRKQFGGTALSFTVETFQATNDTLDFIKTDSVKPQPISGNSMTLSATGDVPLGVRVHAWVGGENIANYEFWIMPVLRDAIKQRLTNVLFQNEGK